MTATLWSHSGLMVPIPRLCQPEPTVRVPWMWSWLGDSTERSRLVVAAVAEGGRFWYSLDLRRSAASASMAGVSTTGFRQRARGAETEVRRARFAFRNFSRAESAGSASIRVAGVVRIRR
jgi:hypothetical protein